jgi:hypothetical protein
MGKDVEVSSRGTSAEGGRKTTGVLVMAGHLEDHTSSRDNEAGLCKREMKRNDGFRHVWLVGDRPT